MEARKFIIDEEKVLQKLDDGTAPSDLLNTEVYADALADCIERVPDDKSFTIGLYGDWGTGKSTIIKTLDFWLQPSLLPVQSLRATSHDIQYYF